MRSYGQFCALARTLDVIGERWTLLIIRELFARDSRYSDLREALPGIATNLLAERLRHLQEHGIVEAYRAPAPVRATVYRLTARGRELGPALAALVAWGAPLLDSRGDDEFRMHWLVLGIRTLFRDADVTDVAPLEAAVRSDGEVATLSVGRDGVSMRMGEPAPPAAVTVEGPPDGIVALLTGRPGADDPPGVRVHGTPDGRRRLHVLATPAREAGA